MRLLDGPPLIADGTEIVPGYIALGHIRRGNQLDVYSAWSTERACPCVIKTPRDDRLGDRSTVRALLREGWMLDRFTHPHIVRAYEVVERPRPAVVMETLTGETVDHLVQDGGGPLEDHEAAHLGLQLGSAVRFLHLHQYLHLDLKPSNVIAQSGTAKLIDLNLARPPGNAHAGIGTWCYMAPEQARGGELTAAADVWGLGAVLFEAVTSEAPFDDEGYEDDDEDVYPQLDRRAPLLTERLGVPSGVAALVDACLEPDAARRPSMQALLASLEAVAEIPDPERLWSR